MRQRPCGGTSAGSVVEVLVFCFGENGSRFRREDRQRVAAAWRGWDWHRSPKTIRILILIEESARHAWLASQFANACSDIDMHVGMTVETLGNVAEVFRFRHMQTDKFRARVAAHHVAPGFLQFAVARQTLAVVTPIGVRVQLFPAFVEPVDGKEKRPRGPRCELRLACLTRQPLPTWDRSVDRRGYERTVPCPFPAEQDPGA